MTSDYRNVLADLVETLVNTPEIDSLDLAEVLVSYGVGVYAQELPKTEYKKQIKYIVNSVSTLYVPVDTVIH